MLMLHRPLISNASTSVIFRDKKLNEKKNVEETIGLSQKCKEEILYFGNYAFSLQTVSPNWNGSQ